MSRFRALALAVCGGCIASLVVAAGPARAEVPPAIATFHVGNSLTNDAGMQSGGLNDVLAALGVTRTGGYHLRGNNPLRNTFANPDAAGDIVGPGTGRWPAAFANVAFDAVTFQPWTQATAFEEADALAGYIDALHASPLNRHTAVFVYTGWPAVATGTFPAAWTANLGTLNASTRWPRTDQAVEWIVNEVSARTGVPIGVVPVGDVLAALDARLRDGEAPGLTSTWSLYRDQFHLNTTGSYVASLTMAATLTGLDPRGSALTGVYANVDPAFAVLAQDEVWRAVRNQPRPPLIPEPGAAGAGLALAAAAAIRRRR